MSNPHIKLTGNEQLCGSTLELENVTILDFWKWAFSNLQMNNVRGIFAEWLVAKLLCIPLDIRDSWQEWDLITPSGVKIEVKTSAYLQSWEQVKPSRIVFNGLKGRKLYSSTSKYAHTATYNADMYVFCVQIEKDPVKWNALDIDQWKFYLLSKEEMERLNQKSISLNPLTKICPAMTAGEFQVKATEMIDTIAMCGNSLIKESRKKLTDK